MTARVLHVFPYYLAEDTGGASGVRDVIETTIRLTSPRWRHEVVVPARTSHTSSFERLGAGVLELGRERHVILQREGGVSGFAAHLGDLAVDVPRLAAAIRRHRIDIVHSHSSAYLGGVAAARLAGRPGVLHVHERMDRVPPRLARLHRRISARVANEVVVIADFMVDEWSDAGRPVRCIRNTTADESLDSPRREAGPPIVGFLGRIAPRKGIEFLVRAMAFVRADARGQDARLLIIGGPAEAEDHHYLERLRKEVSDLGLTGSIEFTGPTDRVSNRLRSLRVLGFTAPIDIAPVTLLQAMAGGLPIVSASNGGAEEMVVDGETGFCVTPRDSRAIADCLLRLLTDDRLWQRMSLAARRRFDEVFSPERYRSEIETLYEEAIRRGR